MKQTSNATVCAESGLLSVQSFVKKRQVDFLKKVRARPDFETNPDGSGSTMSLTHGEISN